MKLFIQVAPNNTELYDLIKIDQTGHYCVLQDTLENCLELFKKTISEQTYSKTITHNYDSSNHLVIDYTSGKPVIMDGVKFCSL